MTMSNNQAKGKLQERKEILTDVIRQRKRPKRIPLLSQVRAWPILDAGYSLIEGLSDSDKLIKSTIRMQELYNFDAHIFPGTRFPYKVYEALGSSPYLFDDANSRIEYIDTAYMGAEDYPKLFEKGVIKFLYEDIFSKRFKSLEEKTPDEVVEHIAKAVKEDMEFGKFCNDINLYLVENYGVPIFSSGVTIMLPIEIMFASYRGIKGLITDLRRNTDNLDKACEMLNIGNEAGVKKLSTYKPKDFELNSLYTTILSNTILNPKQFEKYSWPTWKAFFAALEETDGIGYIFTEGKMSHLMDFFREIPEKRIVLVTEQDDIRDLRDKLPNLSFAGGIVSYTLGHGTKQQCIDMAKKMVDEIGFDGRLIATTDKMLAFKNDAKGENLAAVNEFITQYSAC